jgi:hypothetical protein
MKLAARFGILIGIFSFLFATYTAVTGPVLLPKADTAKATRERMAKIQASASAEQPEPASGGGCCAKKETASESNGCSHTKEQASGCSHGATGACPSKS